MCDDHQVGFEVRLVREGRHVEEKCFRKRQGKPKSAEGKAEVVALTLVTQEIISEPREWDFEEHSRALLAHIGVTK